MKAVWRILVADDEERILRILEEALGELGHTVVTAKNGLEAIEKLNDAIDLVFTDLKMPEADGFAVLNEVRNRFGDVPVVIMTAFGTVGSAVRAMKLGAYDYVTKPFDLDAVEILLDRALHARALAREHRYLREKDSPSLAALIGSSPPMHTLVDQIRKVGPSDASVLISGETGTGKELVARAIHAQSGRKDRLFVPVNCASIPGSLLESEMFGHVRGAFTGASKNHVGLLELADGGTLFLDEIGDLDVGLQAKILRALEEGQIRKVGGTHEIEVDVRVIAATHRDLPSRIAEGSFRQDLYYRLNVIQLTAPPLRERLEDISLLVQHFLRKLESGLDHALPIVDPDAIRLLEGYAWPGNVRELRNVCERLAVLGSGRQITADLVFQLVDVFRSPDPIGTPEGSGGTLTESVRLAEVEAIQRALERASGSKSRAASFLGISERTLWYKLKKYRDRLSQ